MLLLFDTTHFGRGNRGRDASKVFVQGELSDALFSLIQGGHDIAASFSAKKKEEKNKKEKR